MIRLSKRRPRVRDPTAKTIPNKPGRSRAYKMRLPRSIGGRSCPVVGAVVTRLSVTPAAVTDWPFEGLHWQEISAVAKEGVPEQV